MKSFLIALAIVFSATAIAKEEPKKAPVKQTEAKKEVKKPEVKKPTKVKKAPAAVQKKAAEANK